jgi:beta-phosphoglucomutase-like phosphatase (HAD superfamily)
MPPFGVLWDMDGVLIDTRDPHYDTWVEALAPYDLALTRPAFDAIFGMNNARVLEQLFGAALSPAEAVAISQRKEARFRERVVTGAEPLPGGSACAPIAALSSRTRCTASRRHARRAWPVSP